MGSLRVRIGVKTGEGTQAGGFLSWAGAAGWQRRSPLEGSRAESGGDGILKGMTSAATTIKVPRELRDRIAQHAKKAGEPAAAFLSELLDAYERANRFAAVRAAHASADGSYRVETAGWDAVAVEGIDGD